MPNMNIYYAPRPWQANTKAKLKRFHTLVVHRRAGKTMFALSELIETALQCPLNRPQAAYIAPTYKQAKQVAWEPLKSMLRDFIKAGIAVPNEAELRIDFPGINGGRIMLLGADNPDAVRGIYLDKAVLDEVADQPREMWSKIIRPALSDRRGKALFIGTPKGKNYFHTLYTMGLGDNPEWGSDLLTWKDTGALSTEEINSVKKEITEEEFEQEFECSFTAAITGAYFGKNIDQAEREKRIGPFPPDKESPVIAAWDIGFDGTAIWFCQLIANKIIIVDFLQVEDVDIPDVVSLVKQKPYVYDYQVLPQDAAKRLPGNKGKTIKDTIEGYGLKCVKAQRTSNLLDDINNTRRLLDKCYINLYNCEKGLDLLRLYRAKTDKNTGLQLSTPIHDESSHAADALRTLAAGIKKRDYQRDYSPVQVKGSYDPYRPNYDVVDNKWDVFNAKF